MRNIDEEYRRLLRWYPRAWRDQNQDVMLGTFLDAARARGITTPTDEDRRSILLAGLRQRAIGSGQRSLVATTALAVGVAFTVFYCTGISWDPAGSLSGYVGPFTNPSFILGLLLALALALSVKRVTAAAHLVAVLAIATSIAFGVLGWRLGWLGPSLPTSVLFALFGACGLSRSNRISRGLLLIGAAICGVLAATSLDTFRLQSVYGLSPFWQQELVIAAVSVLAAALMTWPWHRRSRSPRSSGTR